MLHRRFWTSFPGPAAFYGIHNGRYWGSLGKYSGRFGSIWGNCYNRLLRLHGFLGHTFFFEIQSRRAGKQGFSTKSFEGSEWTSCASEHRRSLHEKQGFGSSTSYDMEVHLRTLEPACETGLWKIYKTWNFA